jgi:SAM-dependent methyltransferase
MHRNSPDAHAAAGYVTDVVYPETFFRELSPVWLNYVAALGRVPPRDLDGPFTYLELGCGQASSVITNAAAFPGGRFHACDINREHIDHARARAAAFGIRNIEIHQCTFEQLRREALPAFDFIVAHGVYSWVAAHDRQSICDLVRDHLEPGGLFYLSYNSLPGWAGEMPLRKLLVELAAGEEGDTTMRAGRALRSLQHIGTGRLKFLDTSPACAAALAAYARAPIPYVAHEFLNATWEPFYCVDVADQLQQAGVAYVGSATLTDNHAALLIDESTLRNIGQLAHERQRRLALDFATNQQFRRDVFWRPTCPGGASGPDCSLIGCIDDPQQLPARIRVPRGVVHFQSAFILRLRDLLARGPLTIGAAVGELGSSARAAADEIRRNLLYLVAAGALAPFARPSARAASATVAPAPIPTAAQRGCQPANSIVERALAYSIARQAQCVLPSEILGNGVRIGLAEAASVSRYLEGGRAGAECVSLVRRLLRLGILKEGRQ